MCTTTDVIVTHANRQQTHLHSSPFSAHSHRVLGELMPTRVADTTAGTKYRKGTNTKLRTPKLPVARGKCSGPSTLLWVD